DAADSLRSAALAAEPQGVRPRRTTLSMRSSPWAALGRSDLQPNLVEEVSALLVRGSQRIELIAVLHKRGAADLGGDKTLERHVTTEPGRCHRCRNLLHPGQEVECPKCKALNLNWR